MLGGAEFYLFPSLWDNKYCEFLSNVNYSYTNAKINFVDAFYATWHGMRSIYIQYCNFEGVNLSNNKFNNELFELYLSNISDTNICLKNTGKICITDSIVSNVDLSWVSVNLEDMFDSDNCFSLDSNYYNTGLKISGNIEKLDRYEKNIFIKYINNGRLSGCYVNGKLVIFPVEEKISKLARRITK